MSKIGPPSPSGYPLVGNAHQLIDPLAFGDRCRGFDASVVAASAGSESVYVIQDPAAIEEVLVSKSGAFWKRDLLREKFAAALGYTDVEYDEELGLALRSPWQDPPIREALAARSESVVARTDRAFREADGEVRDAHSLFQQVLFDVFTTVIFGTDDVDADGLGDTIDAISKKNTPRQVALAELVPMWDQVPTRTNRRFHRAVTDLKELFEELLASSDEQAPIRLLREAVASTDGPDDPVVVSEVATIMLGALEPLAVGAAVTCDYIARHDDVQQRLRSEVEAVEGDLTPENLADLDYLEAVLSESLRLYPPIYVLFRQVTEPVEIAGYHLEAGSRAWVPIWSVHRDPDLFERPTTFDPDRWLDPRDRHSFEYFPFGGGNRRCAGATFAMQTLRVLVASMLRTASLDPVGERPTLRAELSLEPADGIPVGIRVRD